MSFDPTSITGLAAWFDASDATTLFTDAAGTTPVSSDNDPVQRWEDKSGASVVVTEETNPPTYKTAIQNGLDIVRFNGTNNRLLKGSALLGAAETSLSVFIVAKQALGSAYVASIYGDDFALYGSRYNQWAAYLNGSQVEDIIDNQLLSTDDTAFHAMSILWQGKGLFLARLDGMESQGRTYDATKPQLKRRACRPNALATLRLASNLGLGNWTSIYCECDIAEVVIYKTDEILDRYQEVESYLLDKWGLSWGDEQI